MVVLVRVVRRATAGAVNVVLGGRPYPIIWLPRFVIPGGDEIKAGDRDFRIDVPEEWLERKLLELAEGGHW